MSGSADTPPPNRPDAPGGEDPVYQVAGTGDGNEGRWARGTVLIDPATGAPYSAATMVADTVALHDTASPSHGAVVTVSGSLQTTIPDGDDHATGATTDTSSANTVIGRLKKLLSVLPAALTGSGNLRVAVQEALPAGSALVGKVGIDQTTPGATNGVTILPDGSHGATYVACPAGATTVVKASAGVLKALAMAGTGTAGTVALVDGSTTIYTAGIPAAVGAWALPLPPEGMALGTSIKVTTTGSGVTALAVYV